MKYGTLCYLSVSNEVLMLQKPKRENDPNSEMFTIPGGKLKPNEALDPDGILKSCYREVKEETGLYVLEPRFAGTVLFDNSEKIFRRWKNPEDYYVFIFTANNFNGNLIEESDEGIPQWIRENDINNLPKNAGDMRLYEWIRSRRRFAGVIKHKGIELDEEGTFVEYF